MLTPTQPKSLDRIREARQPRPCRPETTVRTYILNRGQKGARGPPDALQWMAIQGCGMETTQHLGTAPQGRRSHLQEVVCTESVNGVFCRSCGPEGGKTR